MTKNGAKPLCHFPRRLFPALLFIFLHFIAKGERYSPPCFGYAMDDAVPLSRPLAKKNNLVKARLIVDQYKCGRCRFSFNILACLRKPRPPNPSVSDKGNSVFDHICNFTKPQIRHSHPLHHDWSALKSLKSRTEHFHRSKTMKALLEKWFSKDTISSYLLDWKLPESIAEELKRRQIVNYLRLLWLRLKGPHSPCPFVQRAPTPAYMAISPRNPLNSAQTSGKLKCERSSCSTTGAAPMIHARSPFISAARSVYGTPQITALVDSRCSNPQQNCEG
ncbi:hypothetical protein F2P81_023616 [Scophthalmus maximus]|uniref:Uncharacterized protein n=1 Tax=Scophthalmus maximus TaxID=52904 RepID=A0A6A4S2Q9_SCOMX|nr:hypothetical protein F2P81_023616 [Scophthalmus maximus]